MTMRILFVASNPSITTALDLEEELRSLEQELPGIRDGGQISLTARHAVRPDDLVRHIREEQPMVLHFSGHRSAAGIVLRTDQGGYTEVSGEQLRRLLVDGGIELLVLNACYTQGQADGASSAVRAVVGSTSALDDEAARRFAVAFYRTLTDGLPIREAFRVGSDSAALHEQDSNSALFDEARLTVYFQPPASRLPIGKACRDGSDSAPLHGLDDVFWCSGEVDRALVKKGELLIRQLTRKALEGLQCLPVEVQTMMDSEEKSIFITNMGAFCPVRRLVIEIRRNGRDEFEEPIGELKRRLKHYAELLNEAFQRSASFDEANRFYSDGVVGWFEREFMNK